MVSDDNQTPGGPNGNSEDDEFSFADIPVLGRDAKKKREDFSFAEDGESPPPPSPPKDNTPSLKISISKDPNDSHDPRVNSFTKMLQDKDDDSASAPPPPREAPQGTSLAPQESPPPIAAEPFQPQEAEQFEPREAPPAPEPTPEATSTPPSSEEDIYSFDDSPGKKKLPTKLIAIGGAAAGLVVVIIITVMFLFSGGEAKKPAPARPAKKSAKKPEKAVVKPEEKPAEKQEPETKPEVRPKQVKINPNAYNNFLKQTDTLGVMGSGEGMYDKLVMETLAANPYDFALQVGIQNYTAKKFGDAKVTKIFKEWYEQHKGSSYANYLYAKALSNSPEAVTLLRHSLKLDPKLKNAYYRLAWLYTLNGKYPEAAKVYSDLLKKYPKASNARYLLAQAKMRSGKGPKAIEEYKQYLIKNKMSPGKAALAVLPLARQLPTPKLSAKLLAEVKNDKKTASKYKAEEVKQRAFYGKLANKDFGMFYPHELKPYHQLYLLSRGNTTEVMRLPTPPEEFPDFWKTFVAYENGISFWKTNAEKIVVKYRGTDKKWESLAARLWLGKITPEQYLASKNLVNPDNLPLFYFLIAEYYRKQKDKEKAGKLFSEALKIKPNLYRNLIQYYQKKP